jgi:hypothetical protein
MNSAAMAECMPPVKEHILILSQKIRQRAEVNKADQIALLEATRGELLAQKMQLEKKVEMWRDEGWFT